MQSTTPKSISPQLQQVDAKSLPNNQHAAASAVDSITEQAITDYLLQTDKGFNLKRTAYNNKLCELDSAYVQQLLAHEAHSTNQGTLALKKLGQQIAQLKQQYHLDTEGISKSPTITGELYRAHAKQVLMRQASEASQSTSHKLKPASNLRRSLPSSQPAHSAANIQSSKALSAVKDKPSRAFTMALEQTLKNTLATELADRLAKLERQHLQAMQQAQQDYLSHMKHSNANQAHATDQRSKALATQYLRNQQQVALDVYAVEHQNKVKNSIQHAELKKKPAQDSIDKHVLALRENLMGLYEKLAKLREQQSKLQQAMPTVQEIKAINKDVKKHLDSQLEQIKTSERLQSEILALQNTMASKHQEIDRCVQDRERKNEDKGRYLLEQAMD